MRGIDLCMGMNSDGARPDRRSAWSFALGAGAEIIVIVVAGTLCGRWADDRLGTQPWLTLAGSLSGIGIGLYRFIRETSDLSGRRP
jgi:F0F1-type ATP synthase assembly protein I